MKTSIGGDRLGSGNKQTVSLKNYSRSTHDLSYKWRSSMAPGTLVPFMKKLALPGDTFDINLGCEVLTLPTIGPLFGSFKVQLDVFQVPIRLYNAQLHMNKLGIGLEMDKVKLPKINVRGFDNQGDDGRNPLSDDYYINPSCLLRYLGVAGLGRNTGTETTIFRKFNAVPYLAYWDIYKNYYANKQEEIAYAVHTDSNNRTSYAQDAYVPQAFGFRINVMTPGNDVNEAASPVLKIVYRDTDAQPDAAQQTFTRGAQISNIAAEFDTIEWDEQTKTLTCSELKTPGGVVTWSVHDNAAKPVPGAYIPPKVTGFTLSNIDDMKLAILQHTPIDSEFVIDQTSPTPYNFPFRQLAIDDTYVRGSSTAPLEGLALKTYQSDLFNNWISTEWIDGPNGVNAVTSVDTSEGSFTIDALNLANKVYVMLNRIAISGGTYDDWLDAVYTHERTRSIENPMYMGSLIKELAFQEVVSNADSSIDGNIQPLGTLAGRGRLTNKNKGGRVKIKVDEPSYIIGIASITPRVDYSQGNDWDMLLDSVDSLHKPALDAIGFQDLVTDGMAWQDTERKDGDVYVYNSVGKQPAWINYMTAVDKVYGNFADVNKEMFMVLNRRYDIGIDGIEDLTTYIDPSKYNFIFAQTELSAQNFWVQIAANVTARRKMSAKVIPNL